MEIEKRVMSDTFMLHDVTSNKTLLETNTSKERPVKKKKKMTYSQMMTSTISSNRSKTEEQQQQTQKILKSTGGGKFSLGNLDRL